MSPLRFKARVSSVLSLGYVYLTVRITEAFGLPSLFCNVASLPFYSKLNSKCDS